MPTVILNRNVFEKLVGKKLPTEKLKERISMIGTDLAKVTDTEIYVEVFPNRPDWLSEQGFARSFAAFIGEKTGLKKYAVKKSGLKVIVDQSVTMRPYTACALVKKLSFNDERIREVMQVQEKLATTHGRNRKKSAYGLYPAKNISFPITYTAKDPKEIMFQPLGFPHKISADQVEEVHPKGKEYKHLAQGWKKYPFFIDAKNKVLCMLPYTNSEDTGKVDESTTEVFIECTGTDLNNVMVALNILATTLADMGGEIYSLEIVYPDKTITTPNLMPTKMKVEPEYFNKRLGLTLKEKEMAQLLERMSFGYEKGHALVPAYRADVLHPADIMEDIAIAYGYEHFEEKMPAVATIGEEDAFEVFKGKVRELLLGLGMFETSSYSLIDEQIQTTHSQLFLDEKKIVCIIDPVSMEYNALRFWLIPSVLQVLQRNSMTEYPQRIFEIGRVFANANTDTTVKEAERVCVAVTHRTADFTEIKQVVEYLLSQFGIQSQTRETEHTSFIPGRVGRVRVGDVDVAYVGEIHPKVLNNFKLENPVVMAELNLTEIWKKARR